MTLKFTKMHGLGNDFILIDATQMPVSLSPELIRRLSDRRTGIGFDQLLLLESAQNNNSDFIYRIYNADGNEVEQCGNGARCVAHYIFTEKNFDKKDLALSTLGGVIKLKKEQDDQITVNMGPPQFAPAALPFITPVQSSMYQLQVADQNISFGAVSMGNPHIVLKVADIDQAPTIEIGQALQHHSSFPNQVNVGFMQIVSRDQIRLRVFERGAGETLACGTGACAAMVIGRSWGELDQEVKVQLPKGYLTILWRASSDDVFLTGPAEVVFKGEID